MPKVLVWDIESTSLNATFGTILCIGYKWLDSPEVTVRTILEKKNKNFLDDGYLVAEFAKVFDEADYHITWYGDRFDLPMVRSKLIKYGQPPLSPKPSLDLWRPARKFFKFHSNRLAVWEQLLATPDSKTPIDFDSWLRAAHGDKEAIAEVVDHCEKDVLVLEEVYLKMRPWLDNEPVRALFTEDEGDACTTCGSLNVVKRGFHTATTRVYQRYQCKACGHWFRGTKSVYGVQFRSM